MSEKEIKRIKCPKCGALHDFEIWVRINTDLDPDLGKKVKSGELFRTTCPFCGQQIDVVYPCLYHEMENKVMIYYAPGAQAMKDAAAAFDEGAEEISAKRGFDPTQRGYRNRVVGSLYDLQEKIAIFDAGLDDRIIEICKVMIGSELQQSQPEAAFDDLLFYQDSTGSRLALMRNGNAFASVSLPGDIYTAVGDHYKPLIDRYGDEKVIDMEWVMNSVNRAGEK